MGVVDIIEGPIRMGVDGFFSMFEGGKKKGGSTRGTSSSPFRSKNFGSNQPLTKEQKIKKARFEKRSRTISDAQASMKYGQGNRYKIKTGYKPKKSIDYSNPLNFK